MAWDLEVAPGKHTLRVTVIGRGGTYEYRDGRKVKKFKGRLVSNEAEFLVESEQREDD